MAFHPNENLKFNYLTKIHMIKRPKYVLFYNQEET